jgi:diketogulonate reductase-like aldo/keto reductase
LAWVLAHPNVVVIPGASSVQQAEANAAAADLELAHDEVAALTDASDSYLPIHGGSAIPASLAARARSVGERARRVREGLRS